MIDELSSVVLLTDLPDRGLTAGDIGTIVMQHDTGHEQGYTVEFLTLAGETVAVVTLPATQVRAILPNEIAHARQLVASTS